MRHGNNLSVKQSKREEPLFAVGLARIFRSDCVSGKYLLCVCEIDTALVEVCLALVLVPREQPAIVATARSYGKPDPAGL